MPGHEKVTKHRRDAVESARGPRCFRRRLVCGRSEESPWHASIGTRATHARGSLGFDIAGLGRDTRRVAASRPKGRAYDAARVSGPGWINRCPAAARRIQRARACHWDRRFATQSGRWVSERPRGQVGPLTSIHRLIRRFGQRRRTGSPSSILTWV
jgi:hypothetical protein